MSTPIKNIKPQDVKQERKLRPSQRQNFFDAQKAASAASAAAPSSLFAPAPSATAMTMDTKEPIASHVDQKMYPIGYDQKNHIIELRARESNLNSTLDISLFDDNKLVSIDRFAIIPTHSNNSIVMKRDPISSYVGQLILKEPDYINDCLVVIKSGFGGLIDVVNSTCYEGQFQDGLEHGFGVFIEEKKGLMSFGLWKLGELDEQCMVRFENKNASDNSHKAEKETDFLLVNMIIHEKNFTGLTLKGNQILYHKIDSQFEAFNKSTVDFEFNLFEKSLKIFKHLVQSSGINLNS